MCFGRPVISAVMPAWERSVPSLFEDLLDLTFAVRAALGQVLGDFFIFFRVHVAESQVFQLPLDLPDPKAVGQGSKDIQRLLGDPAPLVFRHIAERAHIVQPVSQLDEDHPDILAHCDKRFAQGF